MTEVQVSKDIRSIMQKLGNRARSAAAELARAPNEAKIVALRGAANAIRGHLGDILMANQKDIAAAQANGVTDAFIDRLHLDEARIEAVARGLDDVAVLPDPVGEVIGDW
ncbi:MAG TPA: gamma-glutamyl-phosphate reductase, partial [Alphaproteobacteria bacterium]|nr:gamma-glutamyl-phosphate reductase [Alphaproteobacteria bacterium]